MAKFKAKGNPQKQSAPPILNRKQKRKEGRKQKKESKRDYFLKRFGKEAIKDESGTSRAHLSKNEKHRDGKVDKAKDKVEKLKNASEMKRKKMLKQANLEEEKTIQKLSKQLNLSKKRKGNIENDSKDFIPKSFMDDGLGYILEACDSEKLKNLDMNADESGSDEDMDNLSLENEDSGSDLPENDVQDDIDNDDMNESSDENEPDENSEDEKDDILDDDKTEDQDEFPGENDQVNSDVPSDDYMENIGSSGDEDDSNEEDNDEKDEAEIKSQTEETWEDIYGRKRDQAGNVVQTKYIPPALRALQQGSNDLSRLEKQLKGQLNRLAESNMQSIARFIEDVYSRNSRNSMNECMVKILKNSILLTNALTPERLVMEHAGVISILHANVGTEVGASVTQKWVESFIEEYKNSDLNDEENSNKILDNYIFFTCYLYAFNVFSNDLMFDIVEKLVESYKLKDIDLIILLLKCIGFNLRKDDPSRLKNLIVEIQKKSALNEENASSRTKFMLESLLAIKNNNVKKLPNYDPTYQIHLQKILKNFLRPGTEITPLNVKLDDLMNADTRGRWWIVGSAWTGRELDNEASHDQNIRSKNQPKFSDELLKLARKMRMNTDARKLIFCTVMTSNDYMDAFEKLSKIDLKSPVKEREVAFVLTKCCLKEKKFNPFYAHVASKLAGSDRKFRMSVQCALWDRIAEIVQETDDKSSCTNLALFTSVLIKDQVLTIACLKKIEFADMNKSLTLFLRTLLKDLLTEDNDSERNNYFSIIAGNAKFSMLRESLRLFMHHFLLKSKKEKDPKMKKRVEMAENALISSANF